MAIIITKEDQRAINTMLMDFHTVKSTLSSVRVADPQSAAIQLRASDTMRSIARRMEKLGITFNQEAGFDEEQR